MEATEIPKSIPSVRWSMQENVRCTSNKALRDGPDCKPPVCAWQLFPEIGHNQEANVRDHEAGDIEAQYAYSPVAVGQLYSACINYTS